MCQKSWWGTKCFEGVKRVDPEGHCNCHFQDEGQHRLRERLGKGLRRCVSRDKVCQ